MYNRDKIIEVFYEIKEEGKSIKPYVVILQPRRSLEETPAQKLDGPDSLHVDFCGFTHGFCNIGGEKVDVARNYLLDTVIETGAKYAFFVGEDTVIPYNGFLKLHETAEQNPDAMIVGVYYIKLSVPMIMVKTGEWIAPANVDPGQIYEVHTCGLDCALIPVSILKKIKEDDPEIPFTCVCSGMEDLPFIGEDNFFEYRLRKAGFKILVNTDVQCLHMDLESGKYTAHPSVEMENYFTNIPITEPLTMKDKRAIDLRWMNSVPKGTGPQVETE